MNSGAIPQLGNTEPEIVALRSLKLCETKWPQNSKDPKFHNAYITERGKSYLKYSQHSRYETLGSVAIKVVPIIISIVALIVSIFKP